MDSQKLYLNTDDSQLSPTEGFLHLDLLIQQYSTHYLLALCLAMWGQEWESPGGGHLSFITISSGVEFTELTDGHGQPECKRMKLE